MPLPAALRKGSFRQELWWFQNVRGCRHESSGAFLNSGQSDGSGKLGLKEFYVLWKKIQQYQVRTQEGPRQGWGICWGSAGWPSRAWTCRHSDPSGATGSVSEGLGEDKTRIVRVKWSAPTFTSLTRVGSLKSHHRKAVSPLAFWIFNSSNVKLHKTITWPPGS